ncbi:BppU family phage baseplate upper protein [Staphylococcus lugdunensis]|uniref:SGNH/GDSL hydrolase family protein n=1 Tax=Staphylococcus lugdunensis TaxID=28035 RepID=UPI001F4C7F30|nr:SGNH/GDSL hydrolase family protein [Staphylococcus lugdunensis]MCH8657752.1 BppU family phage baseplate upper protein [Staphylococcus lugdunensis]MCH8668184.1 BppU family phage baseplate upper protein [Staphylococcus lugdunensis]
MIQKLKDVVTNINVSNVENGFIGANFYTEDDGSAYIRITIKNNNEVLDFTKTDMLPRLDLFCSDGSIFTNEPLDILMPKKGVIQYKVRDNVIQHVGKMDAKLFLANDKDSIHVANFYFTITDSGMTGPIGKEVHVDSLQYLVERVMKENAMGLLDDSFKEKLETDLKTYVNENPDKFKGSKGEPGKDGKISFNDLTDAEKQELKGMNSIYSRSVSYDKTDYLLTGKNIFNPNTLSFDTLLNYLNGQESKAESYVTSDFLPVQPNTAYTQSQSDIVTFYDVTKKFISGLSRATTPNQPRTFKTPDDCYFIRTSTLKPGVYAGYSYLQYQIEKGDASTSYEKFYYKLPGLSPNIPNRFVNNEMIYDQSIDMNKLNFVKQSDNLFDSSKVTTSKYVNQTNGLLSDNANYSASDYIYIKDATTLSKNNNFATYAFYNKNFDFMPITTTATTQMTVPQDAWYIRFSMLTSAINSTMLVKSDKVPESYIPYEIKIPSKFIEKEAAQDKTDYNIDSFGKHTLKSYTADISKQLNADYAGKTEIAFIGDSWVQGGEFRGGDRLTLPLKEKFMKLGYADGGIGFISLANNHTGNGLVSVELNGSWTQYDSHLDIGPKAKGLDTAMVESSTVGDSIVITFNEEVDYYELHTLNVGKWRYKVDAGDWVSVDATQQEVTPIKLDLGKHTITLEVVEGLVSFIGSYAYKGNKGVVIHKIGNGGLKSSQIVATDRDNWFKQIKRCNANTFGILLGTNDMAASMTITDFEKNMKEIVSRIKEGKPLASVFLISPSGNNVQNTALGMSEYSNALHRVAKDLDIGFISLYRALGDFNTTNSNGLMYKDGVHPNKNGGYAISNVVYDRLLRI